MVARVYRLRCDALMHGALHTWIAEHFETAVDEVRTLAGINTFSTNVEGLEACEEPIARLFGPLGSVTVEPTDPQHIVGDDGVTRVRRLGNIIRVRNATPGPRVMLIGHYDTVFAPNVEIPVRREGTFLHGPGVADAKGGLVLAWLALRALRATSPELEPAWELLIVPDEEIGSPGSAAAIRATARDAVVGLGYEPSFPDGNLAGARSGSGNFDIVVRGRPAHAGRDHAKGRNAIVLASRVATEIADLTEAPSVLTNPGVMKGGSAVNIVPDLAVLRINVRVATPSDGARTSAALKEIVATADAEEGFAVELHGGFTRPPKPLTPAYERLLSITVATARELGIDLSYATTGGVCDGNLMADAGLPNVDNLGPVGGNLHHPAEYVDLTTLSQRAALSAALLSCVTTADLTKETPRS